MNRHTATSLLAAAAFGIAMAATPLAGAADSDFKPGDAVRTPACEAVAEAYRQCLGVCESMPPSQIGRCQDACFDDAAPCADTLRTPRTLGAVRPQAGLQRRP